MQSSVTLTSVAKSQLIFVLESSRQWAGGGWRGHVRAARGRPSWPQSLSFLRHVVWRWKSRSKGAVREGEIRKKLRQHLFFVSVYSGNRCRQQIRPGKSPSFSVSVPAAAAPRTQFPASSCNGRWDHRSSRKGTASRHVVGLLDFLLFLRGRKGLHALRPPLASFSKGYRTRRVKLGSCFTHSYVVRVCCGPTNVIRPCRKIQSRFDF